MTSLFDFIGALREFIESEQYHDEANNPVVAVDELLEFIIETLKG
jgi:hypothetical protein